MTYYRNNRNSNQKNLRCFPTCAEKHIEKHFCGCPLFTILTMTRKASSNLRLGHLRLVGEFAIAEMLANQGVVTTPNNRRFEGKIEEIFPDVLNGDSVVSSCRVVFNSERRGWHYSWVGSRFTSTKSHVFSVSLLVPAMPKLVRGLFGDHDERSMCLIQVFNSPSFTIASLRRRGVKVSGTSAMLDNELGCHFSYAAYGDDFAPTMEASNLEMESVSSQNSDGSGHNFTGLLSYKRCDLDRSILYGNDFVDAPASSSVGFLDLASGVPLAKRFRPSEELLVDMSPSKCTYMFKHI